MNGKIGSLIISEKKGAGKKLVREVSLKVEYGIAGDAHASSEWHAQAGLFAAASVLFPPENLFPARKS